MKNEKLIHPVIYKVKCASYDRVTVFVHCVVVSMRASPYKIHTLTELLQALFRASVHQEPPLINQTLVIRVLLYNYNPILIYLEKLQDHPQHTHIALNPTIV